MQTVSWAASSRSTPVPRRVDSDDSAAAETSACSTLAEAVALIEAVEKSQKTYMFAENYPYMAFNQEMRRLYRSGLIGDFKYGEGEYVHPMSTENLNLLAPGENHWRNWIPATYYCTHAIAPVMFITDTLILPRKDGHRQATSLVECCSNAAGVA